MWFCLQKKTPYTVLCIAHSTLSGDEGTRTPGLLRAREALSQLSYIPFSSLFHLMGHNGLEPLTFPLSEECSSLLS